MNDAIYRLIADDDHRLCVIRLRDYITVENLREPSDDDYVLELVFDPEYGFDLNIPVVTDDTSNILNIPADLLAIEYEEEIEMAYFENHPLEDVEEEVNGVTERFEEHVSDGCPPCREYHYRVLQKLDRTLDRHLSYYTDEIKLMAEGILDIPATYLADFEVEVAVNGTGVRVTLHMEEIDLGQLAELESVQYMIENRVSSSMKLLPDLLCYGAEVDETGMKSALLYPLLKHTNLSEHKLELYIARGLLGEEIYDKDLPRYTRNCEGLSKSTISKHLNEVEEVLQDFGRILK